MAVSEQQENHTRGFTLLELLAVIAIIVVLMVLVAPAFTSLKPSSDVTTAAYGIVGLLEQARAYAMKNNTYVFVGLVEVDSSVSASVSPQLTTSTTPYGRVAVAIVAAKDGTRGYDINNPGDGTTGSWVTNYSNYNGIVTNAANLVAISKLQRFENLHFLVDFPSWTVAAHPNSSMARSQPRAASSYTLGSTNCKSVTPFTWPLGSPLTSGYQYRFDKVINFDPQGVARIQYQSNTDEIVDCMEVDLQPTRGTLVPPVPANQDLGNQVVLQINPMSGALRMYRP